MRDHFFDEKNNELTLSGPLALIVFELIISAAHRLDIQPRVDGDTQNPQIKFSDSDVAMRVLEKAAQLAASELK